MRIGDCGEERASRGQSRSPLDDLARWRRRRGPRRGRIHPESAREMEAGGRGIYFGEKLRCSSLAVRCSQGPFAWGKASSERRTAKRQRPRAKGLNFTRRLLAWGVLGLATGGFFVLPTHPVAFRRVDLENPASVEKFRFSCRLHPVFSNSFPDSNLSSPAQQYGIGLSLRLGDKQPNRKWRAFSQPSVP